MRQSNIFPQHSCQHLVMDDAAIRDTLDRTLRLLALLDAPIAALQENRTDRAAQADIEMIVTELAKLRTTIAVAEAEAKRRSRGKRR